ncbi:MAG: helix-turn-helix transcriptional regulator [Moraxella sp.]|nr:helix-turn-helix transcriptional regulator [Moraxella sp.]
MTNLRKSIYSPEHEYLRKTFVARRQELGLTQRQLADRLGVIYSLIGKIETGDRRLDVVEFIEFCQGLEIDPNELINLLILLKNKENTTQTNLKI